MSCPKCKVFISCLLDWGNPIDAEVFTEHVTVKSQCRKCSNKFDYTAKNPFARNSTWYSRHPLP